MASHDGSGGSTSAVSSTNLPRIQPAVSAEEEFEFPLNGLILAINADFRRFLLSVTDFRNTALDLPQIVSRPSYEELIYALARLKVKPASWGSRIANKPQSERERKACARYLTNIISSDLTWLQSDEEREKLWEEGSKCLAERCGRTGAPAMTRTWKLWDDISLVIHEPPLTGDNLGLKTWASSYMLAKRLESIGINHKLKENDEQLFALMELGSGTGLVGLAAAAIWKCSVLLTDLPEIIPNLKRNVEYNRKTVVKRGGYAAVQALDWDNPPPPFNFGSSFQFILAADPLYSPDHAPTLARAIDLYLQKGPDARVVIELPYRDQFTRAMAETLRNILEGRGFDIIEQGEETGFDDWEENGEMAEVKCWWGIWRRSSPEVEEISPREELEA